jgi:hypothetical protein
MDTWMSEAMVIQATLLSFLMALWIAWMSLRGLFRMLPPVRITAVPIRPATQREVGVEGRHAG